jgi:hypothetical protein
MKTIIVIGPDSDDRIISALNDCCDIITIDQAIHRRITLQDHLKNAESFILTAPKIIEDYPSFIDEVKHPKHPFAKPRHKKMKGYQKSKRK